MIYLLAQLLLLLSTPTAVLDVCTELIVNGSFDNDLSGWQTPPSTRPAKQVDAGDTEYAQIGIPDSEYNTSAFSEIWQVISLPTTGKLTLSYDYYTTLEGRIENDVQWMQVYDGERVKLIAPPIFIGLRNDRMWMHNQLDLSPLAGRTFALSFGVFNDGSAGNAAMRIDNVSATVCHAPTPVPTVSSEIQPFELIRRPTVLVTPTPAFPFSKMPAMSMGRLGTVAVLLGLLLMIFLLAIAIMRMLRGGQ